MVFLNVLILEELFELTGNKGRVVVECKFC